VLGRCWVDEHDSPICRDVRFQVRPSSPTSGVGTVSKEHVVLGRCWVRIAPVPGRRERLHVLSRARARTRGPGVAGRARAGQGYGRFDNDLTQYRDGRIDRSSAATPDLQGREWLVPPTPSPRDHRDGAWSRGGASLRSSSVVR
jgi:hypothetical protein